MATSIAVQQKMEMRVMRFLAPVELWQCRSLCGVSARFRDSAQLRNLPRRGATANDDNTPKLRQTQNNALAQGQVDAILIAWNPRNEPAGLEAVGKLTSSARPSAS
jgi:hypothetical protein